MGLGLGLYVTVDECNSGWTGGAAAAAVGCGEQPQRTIMVCRSHSAPSWYAAATAPPPAMAYGTDTPSRSPPAPALHLS